VTVEKLHEDKVAAEDDDGKPESGKLGLALRELTEQERAALDTDGGLVVESVEGVAAKAGIERGDVILAVGDTPVRSVEQLRKLTDKSGKTVALLIQRKDIRTYSPVAVG
jgi:serine protease Do